GPDERFGDQGDPAFGAFAPAHADLFPARRLHAGHGRAPGPVHGDHAAAHGEPRDLVRRDRRTAAGEPYGRSGAVGQDLGVGGGGAVRHRPGRGGRGGPVGRGPGGYRRGPGRLVLGGVGGQPPLDGDPRGGRVGVVEPLPGGFGGGVLAHEELHRVAVLQHGAERGQAPVD